MKAHIATWIIKFLFLWLQLKQKYLFSQRVGMERERCKFNLKILGNTWANTCWILPIISHHCIALNKKSFTSLSFLCSLSSLTCCVVSSYQYLGNLNQLGISFLYIFSFFLLLSTKIFLFLASFVCWLERKVFILSIKYNANVNFPW